jgi:hypothetical protein
MRKVLAFTIAVFIGLLIFLYCFVEEPEPLEGGNIAKWSEA